ncbi:MAG: 50S ribosomal protein L21 [Halobacteriovoraceae bacterium]|nr:50S ribosomal protein L21 [Halobacteriovoraceae bacterium]|tara:strand:- start:30449 stop:30754 length:306 start_codon:yes stop_codon:yes gene_type:complete
MYSVVEIKGHQYRVAEGDIIDVQRMEGDVGSTVKLDRVLFMGGDSPKIGAPVVDGAVIEAEIIRQARSRKVIVSKRKPGLYRKKNGHRQYYTALKIKSIKA